VDIACEAVNNAVLRGAAAQVSLSLSVVRGLLSIVVSNATTTGPTTKTSSTRSGLGSRVFDDLADSWSLESQDGVTIFTATIELSSQPKPAETDIELPAV
jgi:hypothetical protein